MNQDEYEKDLKRRQEDHLARVNQKQSQPFRACMHDGCPDCIGTGIKSDGSSCVHMISCPCPKCSPMCVSSDLTEDQWVTAGINFITDTSFGGH